MFSLSSACFLVLPDIFSNKIVQRNISLPLITKDVVVGFFDGAKKDD